MFISPLTFPGFRMPSVYAPFDVAVRCRALSSREHQLGSHRFPYRSDLNYKCVVTKKGTAAVGAAASSNSGVIAVFDPDATVKLHNPFDNCDNTNQRSLSELQEGERRFSFSHVFNEDATNSDVYAAMVRPLVLAALQGYNGTCFAYGMTGSGKSHTMVGNGLLSSLDKEFLFRQRQQGDTSWGMCHYAIAELLQEQSTCSGNANDISISATYVELYNERIRDLLCCTPRATTPLTASTSFRAKGRGTHEGEEKEPEVVEDAVSGVKLLHVTEVRIDSLEGLHRLLNLGNQRRTKASTSTNEASSRSHAILQLTIRSTFVDNNSKTKCFIGKLSLVDLAGSERATATSDLLMSSPAEASDRRREGCNINRSLLALGNCITLLGSSSGGGGGKAAVVHVPYRDSKLTRILKESLGGNTKTVMIATVSPTVLGYEETLSTLKYATRAKAITRQVTQNTVAPPELYQTSSIATLDHTQSAGDARRRTTSERQVGGSQSKLSMLELEQEVVALRTQLAVAKASSSCLSYAPPPLQSSALMKNDDGARYRDPSENRPLWEPRMEINTSAAAIGKITALAERLRNIVDKDKTALECSVPAVDETQNGGKPARLKDVLQAYYCREANGSRMLDLVMKPTLKL